MLLIVDYLLAQYISNMKNGRTHFGVSREGRPFPVHLLHHKYKSDEFESSVILDPEHEQGSPVLSVDLRYWADLSSALTLFYEHDIRVEELVLAGNSEADARLLQFASRLFNESLVSLNLEACSGIDYSALPFLRTMGNLHTLFLGENLFVSDADVEFFLDESMRRIEHVGLNGCACLTDRTLFAISRQGSRILTAQTSNNPNYTFLGANAIALHCDKLKVFDLSNCPLVNFVGVVMEAGASIFGNEKLFQFVGRALTKLHIDDNRSMCQDSLDWICGALPELVEVSMPRVSKLSDANVQGLAFGCPGLCKLRIQGCTLVRSQAILALGVKASCLTELNAASIGKLEPAAVREFLMNCKGLKFLNLARNKGVTDAVFSELEYGKGNPIFLPNLRRLTVSQCSLTAFGISCLAERCRSLEHLDVSESPYHTDAAMLVVSSCCTLLKSLWINDCPAVTDRGVRAICYGCGSLQVLHLSSSIRETDAWGGRIRQYSDEAIVAALDGSRGLKELSVRNQCGIHFASEWLQGAFRARGGHQFLEKIDLRGVDELHLDKLSNVLKLCSELCLVLISDEATLPGVRGQQFLSDAFSVSMYTMGFNSSSSSPIVSASGVVTPDLERGRFCDDDGTESFARSSASSLDGGTSLAATSVVSFHTEKSPKTFSFGIKAKAMSLQEYSIDTEVGPSMVPSGFAALTGHPNRRALRFRDQYFRRRHDELHAIRLIQLKYRIYAIWQRFRYRISARKIANTYKVLLVWRELMRKVREMQIHYSARKIQRYFKNCMLPYIKAATMIQKIYRGRYAKKRVRILLLGQRSAVLIQKVARGMLVRISDRYIMAQIYLKLPPFWRIIMNMTPKTSAADEATRKRIHAYQIQDLKVGTQNRIKHILNDVATDGILAPQLPMYVPQKFDKAPFVSVNDGRKIAFFGHKEGLLWSDTGKTTQRMATKIAKRKKKLQYDENGNDLFKLAERRVKELGHNVEGQNFLSSLVDGFERVPIHQFNVTFWPHTAPIALSDPSTEQYDSMVNNFDAQENSRELLYCQVCRTRMRIVHCKTCQKGFCFFCAFRSHTELCRRNHQMQLMEPRVVKVKELSKSLIYHVDMAKQASYDLQYLVKFMKSATEVKRIAAEARLAREYEQAEEARRMVFLRAQGESNDKHAAATEISLMYRCLKARRVVYEKRLQIALEEITQENAKFATLVIPIQRRFRLFSSRLWFASKGKVFKIIRSRPKMRKFKQKGDPPDIPFAQTFARVEYEARQRQFNQRSANFDKLLEKYGAVLAFLDVNIEHWKEQDLLMPPLIAQLEAVKDQRSAEHEKQSQTTAALKGVTSPEEYEVMEKVLEALWVRVDIAQQRMANIQNIRWWICQHLRSSYRRRQIIKARYADTLKRLEWVCMEHFLVTRIESQLQARVESFKARLGMGLASDWLLRHSNLVSSHLATLDAQQETITLEEISRLERDEQAALEYDSLMEELYQGLLAENRLLAEKVSLEFKQRSGQLESGSVEAVQVGEQLVLVRRKMTQLANSVLDTLKLGIQNKFNEEEDLYLPLYSFPGDDVSLPVDRFDEIDVELIDSYKPPQHVKIHDFFQVYLVQPWLADQVVGDVRLEETIQSKEIDRGKFDEERKGNLTKISDNDAKTIENRRNVSEISAEIQARETAERDGNETVEDEAERMQIISRLHSEVFKLESEIEVMEAVSVKLREMLGPLEKRLEEMLADVNEHRNILSSRAAERERLTNLFFKTEKEIQRELIEICGKRESLVEKELSAIHKTVAILKAGMSNDEFIQRVIDGDISIIERDALRIPLGTRRFELQDCLNEVKPRTSAPAHVVIRHLSEGRLLAAQTNIDCLTRMKLLLEEEEQDMDTFHRRVPIFERAVQLFQEQLLSQRRQKSMQRELVLRKQRLSDLRDMRLRQMREVKEKKEEEAKAIEDEREEARKNYVPIAKRIAKVTKKTVRDAKDLYTELKHAAGTRMDGEELRMAHTIRSKNPDGDSLKVEGVRKLYLTVGKDNTDSFAAQQRTLEDNGVPFYKRMERTIGNQIYIWMQMTFDNRQMITTLELCHKTAGHALYKDPEKMVKDKWIATTDDSTNLVIWSKQDITRLRALKDFAVSLSEVEENRNLLDGFELIEPNLSEFDLPEVSLWQRRIEKIKYNASETTNDVINEVIKTRALLKKNPGDRNMQALMGRLNDKLKDAYEKEKKLLVTDPLKAAVDMMVLTAPELERWMDIFASLDKGQDGSITFDQVFEFIEETPTLVAKEFSSLSTR